MNQQLASQAFQVAPGTWLPESFAFPTGYALAKAVSVTPPEASAWEAERQIWLTTLNQRAEEQTMQAFLAELRAKANVQITNPDVVGN
jgi:peptidyl-prolyl cis-trans isomerase D